MSKTAAANSAEKIQSSANKDSGLPTDLGDPVSGSAWNGRLAIAAAAVLWSTSGFFAKAPWFDGWPEESRGLLLAFWRSLFAISILLPLVRKPTWHPGLLSMCVCFAVMVWSFMSAMVHGPAANAIWLQYLAPVWVMLIGVLFLGEIVTRADLKMFAFCLTGVSLILLMEMSSGGSIFASLLGVLAGVAYAGVVLHMRVLRHMDSAWLIALNHSATVVMLLPWVVVQEGQIPLFAYGTLALFGVIQMSAPYLLFARGLKSVSGPEASILALLEPILLPIWVYVAWHQHPSYQAPRWWTWVGGGLILTGLLLRYLPTLRNRFRIKALWRSPGQRPTSI
jgi:DME family drug/metabolite transporter